MSNNAKIKSTMEQKKNGFKKNVNNIESFFGVF